MRATRGRWVSLASGLVVSLLLSVVTVLAVTSEGNASTSVDLNDGGVWVTSTSRGLAGRLLKQVEQLDVALRPPTHDFDVHQVGAHVVVHDRGARTLLRIDAAWARDSARAEVPQDAQVAVGGGSGAVWTPGGDVWVRPLDELAAQPLGQATPPELRAGAGAEVVVGVDGTVHVLSIARGEVTSVPSSPGAKPLVRPLPRPVPPDATVTAVGATPVVLAGTSLLVPGGATLPLPPSRGRVLQQPGETSPDVVLATDKALLLVPLDGTAARSLGGGGGAASAPVRVGACVHAVWRTRPTYLRSCDGAPGTARPITSAAPGADLRLRVNRGVVVVNDVVSGDLWLAESQPRPITPQWEQVLPRDKKVGDRGREIGPEAVPQHPRSPTSRNHRPVAVDDAFGARAGRAGVLHVTANDSDPDGDVLVVEQVGAVTGVQGRVDPVDGGRSLQFTPAEGAAGGTASFTYTIGDGRPGSTASARVTVAVRPAGATGDQAPRQVRESAPLRLAAGGRVTVDVLPQWVDPDGDPLTLVAAESADRDDVLRFDAAGGLTLVASAKVGEHVLRYRVGDGYVSDGRPVSAAGVLRVTVVPAGQRLDPVVRPDLVDVTVGETARITPLDNDTTPDGRPLRLVRVHGVARGLTVTEDLQNGVVLASASRPGPYTFTYEVAGASRPVSGQVRVDVRPRGTNHPPVAVVDTVTLSASLDGAVDATANDTDPDGDVLVVRTARAPSGSGLSVAVVDHHVLKLHAVQTPTAPVEVTYELSDGRATTQGTVVVRPPAAAGRIDQPPLTQDDRVTVRAGDVVDVPVLRNDRDPEGAVLTLAPGLQPAPGDSRPGLAIVSGHLVRYQAPAAPGTHRLVYQAGDGENLASGTLVVTVRPADPAHDEPPRPQSVQARAFPGETVRIPVPVLGIDADGDRVHVLGLDLAGAPPRQGRIVRVGPDWLEYQADDRAAGTDSFTYAVQDSLGARGTALARVGIAPRPAQNQPPVAVPDALTAPLGRTVSVAVLANDSDPDGDRLALDAEQPVQPLGAQPAQAAGARVRIAVPARDGQVARALYTVVDGRGGATRGSVSVTGSAAVRNLPPVARDDRATPAPGGRTVTVEVLGNDEDPDGSRGDLTVKRVLGDGPAAGARVSADGHGVELPVGLAARSFGYEVADADGATAAAFVQVPAGGNQPPRLRPGAAPVRAKAGGRPVAVDLADVVEDPEGRPVRILDLAKVYGDARGTATATSPTAIRYTPATADGGPSSITLTVTDGSSPQDPAGATATLAVPVIVEPGANRPPRPAASTVEVGAGDPSVPFDLRGAAADPDPGDRLTFGSPAGATGGVSATVSGSTLRVSADAGARRGARVPLSVPVSDAAGAAARIAVTIVVVGSRAPLPTANDDPVDAKAGATASVRVLDNDVNPFPDTPLRVVSVAGVPDVAASTDGTVVSVTPRPGFSGNATVRYRLEDATRDAARAVEGRVLVVVRDVPARPRAPRVTHTSGHAVTLQWEAPAANGSPITSYEVAVTPGGRTVACPATTCAIAELTPGTAYSFSVTAVNTVGRSPSSPPVSATPDAKPPAPPAPRVVFGDRKLSVSWGDVQGLEGSAIDGCTVEIGGATSGTRTARCGPNGAGTFVWTGLTNRSGYFFTVTLHNRAGDGPPSEISETVQPAGPPVAPAAPTAVPDGGEVGGQVRVSWQPPDDNGADITGYAVTVYDNGAAGAPVSAGRQETSKVVQAVNGHDYSFVVTATNKAGTSAPSPRSAVTTAFGRPEAVGAVAAAPADSAATLSFSAPNANGQAITRYEVLANGGAPAPLGDARTVTGLTNGTTYRFQVRACNTYCGPWSAASGAVVPFGKPGLVQVTATKVSPTGIDVSWAPPAQNGRAIVRVQTSVVIDGAGAPLSDAPGVSGTKHLELGRGHSVQFFAQAVDSEGQVGQQSRADAATDPKPPPSIRLSKGASAQGLTGCSSSSCAWIVATLDNFAPGQTVTFRVCSPIDCWPGYPSPSVRVDGNGHASFRTNLYFGYPGKGVWAVYSGADTPQFVW